MENSLKLGRNSLIRYAAVVLIVTLMIGASELLAEKEIIFPEIAAIAVGAIAAPRFAWRTDKLRMLLLIISGAVLGVLTVRYVPIPLFLKLSLAFGLCQLILAFSKTSFAPFISAMVLPVLLGTESWVYPVAAAVLTASILGVLCLLERTGICSKDKFVALPFPGKREFISAFVRVLCVLALSFAALGLGLRFAVAPPLLVAFTEFTNPNCSARKRPVKSVALITLCAAAGAVCRCLLVICLGLPITLAAAAASAIMLCIMHLFGQFLPPAGAIAVLPMLIGQDSVAWYPVQALLGASVLMGLALLLFKKVEHRAEA